MRKEEIVRLFETRGQICALEPIQKGYINQTFQVEMLDESGVRLHYILQQINLNVFPDPDALMENYARVTEHLRRRFILSGSDDSRGSVPTIVPTKQGAPYLCADGECWRMINCFEGVHSMDIPDSAETFFHAGASFGRFLAEMADMPVQHIRELIPNFHNTLSRYRDLERSVERDAVGRVASVGAELAFIRARREKYGLIAEALERGEIPLRVTHNDTNLNNILFDDQTGLPVAVIDLDTVMPSTPLYDFGDSIRIGANTATDDERDLEKVSCDLQLYEAYARGYLSTCGGMLTQAELRLLPMAALIITSEDGIRFLMDHIDGDVYYNIFYDGQNLDRARTQLALVADMEKKLPQIQAMIEKVCRELGLEYGSK